MGAIEQERRRAERDARDADILNRYADELNAQALEGLEHQAEHPMQHKRPKKKKSRKQL